MKKEKFKEHKIEIIFKEDGVLVQGGSTKMELVKAIMALNITLAQQDPEQEGMKMALSALDMPRQISDMLDNAKAKVEERHNQIEKLLNEAEKFLAKKQKEAEKKEKKAK